MYSLIGFTITWL